MASTITTTSTTNVSSWFYVYRNKFLRDKVFSHLGRYRVHDNLFRNGVVFHQYDDLQLSDIINSGKIDLINQKLKEFESLYQIDDNIDNFNNKDSATQPYYPFYQHWLDFDFTHSLANLFKLGDTISGDQMDALLLDIFRVFKIKDHYLKDIRKLERLLVQIPISKRNISIFKLFFTRFDICLHSFRDVDLFQQLVQRGDVLISDFNKLVTLEFFVKNKHMFRNIQGWDDAKCIRMVLLQEKVNLEVLVWLLETSPYVNYNLYVESHPKVDRSKLIKYRLFSVDIVVNEKAIFFNMYSLSLKHVELLEFTIQHYQESFNRDFVTIGTSKPINDILVAKRFIEHVHSLKRIDNPLDVTTLSSEPEFIKLFIASPKFRLIGTNLFCSKENVLLFLRYTSCTLYVENPYYVPHIMEALEEFYQGLVEWNVFSSRFFNLEKYLHFASVKHIDHYKQHTNAQSINSRMLDLYLESGRLDLYNYSQGRVSNLHIFISFAMKNYDLEAIRGFVESDHYNAINFSLPFWFLALGRNKEEKQKAREIVNYFFYENSSLVPSNADTNYGFCALIDNVLFRDCGLVCDKTDLIKRALYLGDLALTKNVIGILNENEFIHFLNTIEDIVLSYFNSFLSTAFKVPIYLFSTFPHQFSQSTLASLASIATKNHNLVLMDILLHRTKVRFIKPQSKEHDQELLEFSWMNIQKSKYLKNCKYDFSLIKVDIPDERFNLHFAQDFSSPTQLFFDSKYHRIIPSSSSYSFLDNGLANLKKTNHFRSI
ncbi:hypothetical protein CYY_008781 [Polysphondylium violaceum]|uniref:Uncharacterized protein n=1 Tax=Polysphondylium violaceum TaxID=133409 RepID=A0A8J4PL23_9MYCE|nr:hypothetical protein CYY_008781 [Polysphondylium violaceum]